LRRDHVRLGLAVDGRDPEQVSGWFSVGDVDTSLPEPEAGGIEPGIVDEREYDGKRNRVSFAKEPSCACFCFTPSLEPEGND
jgi:hypothetical protein